MTTAIAKVFMSGRSQAVRLPKEFRLPGKEVRIRRVGNGLLLEPVDELEQLFKALDAHVEKYGPFEVDLDQPEMPPIKKLFE